MIGKEQFNVWLPLDLIVVLREGAREEQRGISVYAERLLRYALARQAEESETAG